VPEGRYVLAHNAVMGETIQDPFFPTYYPGIRHREEAKAFTLGFGEHLSGLEMRVGEQHPLVKVDVEAVSDDNKALENATVYNKHTDSAFVRSTAGIGPAVKTDASGHATLTAFSGDQEAITGFWTCPEGRGQLYGQTTHDFSSPGTEVVRIILHGQCK
jgi:hypothetical protein